MLRLGVQYDTGRGLGLDDGDSEDMSNTVQIEWNLDWIGLDLRYVSDLSRVGWASVDLGRVDLYLKPVRVKLDLAWITGTANSHQNLIETTKC